MRWVLLAALLSWEAYAEDLLFGTKVPTIDAPKREPLLAKRRKKRRKKRKSNSSAMSYQSMSRSKQTLEPESAKQLGFGLGFSGFLLPRPTLDLQFKYDRIFSFAVEGGGYDLTYEDTRIKGTYTGIDLKFFPKREAFFIGVAFGARTFEVYVTDIAESFLDDETAGSVEELVEPIDWHVKSNQQTVASLRVGWQFLGDSGNGVTLGLGVHAATKVTFIAEAEYPGEDIISEEDFEIERLDKEDQVAGYANGIWPQIELRYVYFFDLHDTSISRGGMYP